MSYTGAPHGGLVDSHKHGQSLQSHSIEDGCVCRLSGLLRASPALLLPDFSAMSRVIGLWKACCCPKKAAALSEMYLQHPVA